MTARLHTQRREKSSKGVDLRWLAYLTAAGIAVFLIISSGRLGMEMARSRLPEKPEAPSGEETTIVMQGSGNAPIFLADTPETLRRFFSDHPTGNSRYSADLTGLGIRRLQSNVEIVILGTEAEAVEVRVASGAIAGTVYWVHHNQLPDTEDFDPIISPIPGIPPN